MPPLSLFGIKLDNYNVDSQFIWNILIFNGFQDFSDFANIKESKYGLKQRFLLYDGYRFTQSRTLLRKTDGGPQFRWRCTSKITNSNRRCNNLLATKIVDGYEMLAPKKCVHKHPKPLNQSYAWTQTNILRFYVNKQTEIWDVIRWRKKWTITHSSALNNNY